MARTILVKLLGGLCLAAASGSPAVEVSESSFGYDADVQTSDLRTDTHELTGNVRVTQGAMSIQAHAATVTELRSKNSRWLFRNDVHIRTPQAELHSDTASASFVDGRIAVARIEGSPARFEQLAVADGAVKGSAAAIEYNFATGVARLEKEVWFTNGKDEFRGDLVIYDMDDQRIQVNPGGRGGRVRGVIRPKSLTDAKDKKSPETGQGQQPQPDGDGA